MALGPKLQMRQTQSLVMTPQLLQSIRLLQLPHAELEQFVEAEIERNPLLERAEGEPEMAAGQEPEQVPERGESDGEWLDDGFQDSAALSDRLDASLENVFPDDPGRLDRIGGELAAQWRSAPGGSASGEAYDIEEFAAGRVTLRQHVAEQIALTFSDGRERLVAGELAEMLDETGYLRGEIEDVAARLGVDEQNVLGVLSACQGFDPLGIFARNLSECLAIQLKARDRLDPAMASLLDNLELLARRDFSRLSRICGVDQEDLVEMLAEIRGLDPRPGLQFSVGSAEPVVPDVIVTAAPEGGWAVELNPATLPRVLVDQSYYARVAARASEPAEREFLSECLQNANWLTRSLDQRARSIIKVASEIVRRQDAFLIHGVRHLKPLNLRMVAEAIGMHESTVSRISANKYMMTPRGVFELRYFYTGAIADAEGGDAHSTEAVRSRIRELIEGESHDVLSDDAIVDLLRGKGIDIARRTVAKYRETMHIPSSVHRRREKRALAAAGA